MIQPLGAESRFRKAHTRKLGSGKNRLCREKDINTHYCCESLAPGTTHQAKYDVEGNDHRHRFETAMPSISMADERLRMEPFRPHKDYP